MLNLRDNSFTGMQLKIFRRTPVSTPLSRYIEGAGKGFIKIPNNVSTESICCDSLLGNHVLNPSYKKGNTYRHQLGAQGLHSAHCLLQESQLRYFLDGARTLRCKLTYTGAASAPRGSY